MEINQVKEEVIDQLSINQDLLYLSESNFPHMIEKRELLETKKRPLSAVYEKEQLHISHEIKKSASYNRRKTTVNQSYNHLSLVMKRAKDIQASLGPEFPTFIKTMFRTHVNGSFTMTVPCEFRSMHLASHDIIHLIDENEEEYMMKLRDTSDGKCILVMGGWKIFSINHNLLEGDILIFQLIKHSTLKVYIVRVNELVKAHHRLKAKSHANQGNMTEANSAAMKQAEAIQANLPPEFPSFIKTMIYSHVTHGFALGFPRNFCYMHMPKKDTTLHLIDENEEDFTANFLIRGWGRYLSGGWKKFSITHELREGDVLIFQLIKPSKLKVYIVRANDPVKMEADLVLSKIIARANQVKFFDYAEEKIVRPLQTDFLKQNNPMVPMNDEADMSEMNSEVIDSEKSAFLLDFKNVTSIENFTIFVNGSIINPGLSEYHKTKYYDLCRARNSFLHTHLQSDIKGKVAVKIISETVNIADNISELKISSPQSEYSIWRTTLEGLQLLGMDLGFLHSKLNNLFSLAFESKEGVDSMRFREVCFQYSCAREEIRRLELKISELKLLEMKVWDLEHLVKKLDADMKSLKDNAEKHEVMFQKEVNAPWF